MSGATPTGQKKRKTEQQVDRPRIRTYEATMDYNRAEELQEEAEQEAEGALLHLSSPADEDDTAREDLRELVGRRRDPPTPNVPALPQVDTTGVAASVGLQRLSGKETRNRQNAITVLYMSLYLDLVTLHIERIENTLSRVRRLDLTQRLHTDSLLRLSRDVREIHRAVHGARRDVEDESREQPYTHSLSLMEPVFEDRVPFDSRAQILDFFRDKQRITRLELYILEQIGWDPRNYAKAVVKTLLTKRYRREVFFPSSSRR